MGTTLEPTAAVSREEHAAERAAIDASTRAPVLFFFTMGVLWLLVGSVFGVLASTKLHWPGFTLNTSWDTFGRFRPAHLNSVIYGWATNAGIGTLLWLMARLGRAKLVYPAVPIVAGVVWNIAAAVGITAVLFGQSTGIEWLEMPPYIPPLLAASVATIAIWGLMIFLSRKEPHVYVTQWYIFAALFWFPWLYSVATLLLLYTPVRGVVQASVNWWFAHNVLGLWFTPIGVGAAYYIIPKIIGRPVHSYYLSIIGFWSLALFYNWLGMHHLVGGPIPAWMVSVSIVSSILMLVPVGAVALNHHMTMMGYFHLLRYSPSLRFVVFGAISYTIVSVQGSFESLRNFHEVAHFTHYTIGHAHLGLYSFYTMIIFGCMYYIVPRLTGWEWASASMIRWHFWLTSVGITIYVVGLSIGGWKEGLAWLDVTQTNVDVVNVTKPYLVSRTVGGIMMTLGHFVFAVLFLMNLMHYGQRRQGATLFAEMKPKQAAQKLEAAHV